VTHHLSIRCRIHQRPHGLAIGLRANPLAVHRVSLRHLQTHADEVKSAVTFLMTRAAPSNYAFKWSAGRSPLPGLKPLFSP
jgi:hypothetical protein